MHIHHLALYTTDLERLAAFYRTYFGAVEHSRYHNPTTGLHTCFLAFDSGAMLEVMQRPGKEGHPGADAAGYAHLAMRAPSPEGVDFLTGRLQADGHTVTGPPRTTGDGYYESTVLDPDGNTIEITSGKVVPHP